jgi:hypothetical protein
MAHDHEHKANGAGYEVEDASVREIVFTGVGLAVGTIIVCFAVAGLFKVLTATEVSSRQPLTQVPAGQSFPPTPRLQEKPWLELQGVRAHEDQVLTTYGWVDKNAGKVRIPIDKAMDIVVQHGLPMRTEGAPGGTGSPKTGRNEGAVPSQGTSFQTNPAGARGNAKK